MTDSSKQVLNSVAEQAARLRARLADTHAAIQRGRADADAPAADRDYGKDGSSNVLPFVRR